MFVNPKYSNPEGRRAHAVRAAVIGLILSATLAGAALAVVPTRRCPRTGGSSTSGTDYSSRGLKGAFGCGSIEPAESQGLDEGDAGFLALGYGVDSNVTLWVTAIGSEHRQYHDFDFKVPKSDLGGLELSLQYSFVPESRLRPYGRIGLGAYSVEDERTHDAMTGGGVRLGLGADYFLSRHCALGLEWMGRSAHYSRARFGEEGEFHELPENVDADASGVIFSVTLQ